MRVKVMFFASIRERAGRGEMSITLTDGTTLRHLVEAVEREIPDLLGLEDMMMSINGRFARVDEVLREGDDVAFLPPVSGG